MKPELQALIARLKQRAGRGQPAALPENHEAAAREVAAQPSAALAERFAQAASASGARVSHTDEASLAAHVAGLLVEHEARSVWVDARSLQSGAELASDLLKQLAAAGVPLAPAEPDDETMLALDAAVTGVRWAIAETGSVVCDTSGGKRRSSSLLPRVHVAVVWRAQLLADLIDLFEALPADGSLPANVNIITGPSKTADIEGVLVTGVHGPGVVCWVLVERRQADAPL